AHADRGASRWPGPGRPAASVHYHGRADDLDEASIRVAGQHLADERHDDIGAVHQRDLHEAALPRVEGAGGGGIAAVWARGRIARYPRAVGDRQVAIDLLLSRVGLAG